MNSVAIHRNALAKKVYMLYNNRFLVLGTDACQEQQINKWRSHPITETWSQYTPARKNKYKKSQNQGLSMQKKPYMYFIKK